MKLRNKWTGEIIELLAKPSFVKRNDDYLQSEINTFNSLAELNEEWEDATEEPKDIWWIDNEGNVNHSASEVNDYFKKNREIGNYFKTKEEAEKAVEKLKAWKRLKDKGFRFVEGWLDNNNDFIIKAKLGTVGLIDQPDVSLLFGGEG